MKYIEAPNSYKATPGEKSVFLAGGINGCPNWQQKMVQLLSETKLIVLNPRREDFPFDDEKVEIEQIKWEFHYLREADAIIFWFPKETLCPIALNELGAFSMTDKPIFVGIHKGYKKLREVEIQVKIARPDVEIEHSLDALAKQVLPIMIQTL